MGVYHHHKEPHNVHHCKMYSTGIVGDERKACHCYCWYLDDNNDLIPNPEVPDHISEAVLQMQDPLFSSGKSRFVDTSQEVTSRRRRSEHGVWGPLADGMNGAPIAPLPDISESRRRRSLPAWDKDVDGEDFHTHF